MTHPLSLYIHWPFCISKCPYCDFNSHVRETIDETRFVDAYIKELEHYADLMQKRGVHTVFFGGGTPSLMPPSAMQKMLDYVRPYLVRDPEITMEANPSSIETAKLEAFKKAGVNRLSIGVQSFDNEELKFLGRAHDAAAADAAIKTAEDLFGARFSFDLIYCLPGQSRQRWRRALGEALEKAPAHLSLYELTIETGTPFYYAVKKGDFTPNDADLHADFYCDTAKIMRDAGYVDYETSNYARPGFESRHNLQYWRYRDYIGVGPGAHGRYVCANGVRRATVAIHKPEKWAEAVHNKGVGTQHVSVISPQDALAESLLTGLRLKEGVSFRTLENVCGEDLRKVWNEESLRRFIAADLLVIDDATLRCGHAGRLAHTGVIVELLNIAQSVSR